MPSSDQAARLERALAYGRLIEGGTFDGQLDASRDAVVITDGQLDAPGPHIEYVNPAFEALTGFSGEDLRGNSPRLLQGYDTDGEELLRLRRALSAGEPFQGEIINYRRNGREYVIGWVVVPIHDADGAVRRWLSVQNDVMQDRQRVGN